MLVPRHMNISTPSIHVGKLLAADQQCKVSNEYRSDITASSSTQAVCLHSTISKPKSAVGYSVNMALADALAVNAEKASAADLDKWIYAPSKIFLGCICTLDWKWTVSPITHPGCICTLDWTWPVRPITQPGCVGCLLHIQTICISQHPDCLCRLMDVWSRLD